MSARSDRSDKKADDKKADDGEKEAEVNGADDKADEPSPMDDDKADSPAAANGAGHKDEADD